MGDRGGWGGGQVKEKEEGEEVGRWEKGEGGEEGERRGRGRRWEKGEGGEEVGERGGRRGGGRKGREGEEEGGKEGGSKYIYIAYKQHVHCQQFGGILIVM